MPSLDEQLEEAAAGVQPLDKQLELAASIAAGVKKTTPVGNADRQALLDVVANTAKTISGAYGAPIPEWLTKAALTKGGKVGDVAFDVGTPIAGAIVGGLAGPEVGIPMGAAGGLAGNSIKQAREYFRGERDTFSPGQAIASTAMGAFPGTTAGKTIAGTIGRRAAEGFGLGAGSNMVEQAIDTGKVDPMQAMTAGVIGAPIGAGFGALEKGVPALWNKIRGKSLEEAKTILAEAKAPTKEAAPAITEAQNQIEEMMGMGAEPKSAKASAQIIQTEKPNSAEASAQTFDETGLTPSEVRARDFDKARAEDLMSRLEAAQAAHAEQRIGMSRIDAEGQPAARERARKQEPAQPLVSDEADVTAQLSPQAQALVEGEGYAVAQPVRKGVARPKPVTGAPEKQPLAPAETPAATIQAQAPGKPAPDAPGSFIFASPSTEDLKLPEAVARLTSKPLYDYAAQARKIAPEAKVQRALGDWADGAEHTTAITYDKPQPTDLLLKQAAELGLLGKQKNVLVGKLDDAGNSALHVVEFPKGTKLEDARQALIDVGIPHRTLVPTKTGIRAYVFDQDLSLADNILKLADHELEPTTVTKRATGDFLGDKKWASRDAAAAEYRRLLDQTVEAPADQGGAGRGDSGIHPAGVSAPEREPATAAGSGQPNEGAGAVSEVPAGVQLPAEQPLEHAVGGQLELIHYSGQPALSEVEPKFLGRGSANRADRTGTDKSFFFVKDSPTGQDTGLINNAGKTRYAAEISGDRIYDWNADPLKLADNPNRWEREEKLKELGYAGFASRRADGAHVVALFEPVSVRPAGPAINGERAAVSTELMTKLGVHATGAAAGFAYGWAEGKDLPTEQRLANALSWMAFGGTIPPTIGRRLVAAAIKSTKPSTSIAKVVAPVAGAKTMADVDRIFTAAPKKGSVGEMVRSLPGKATTAIQNVLDPITRMEEGILGKRPKLPLGDRFSLVAGAAGKAETRINQLDKAQDALVPDLDPKDINRFFFLRRTLDRLQTDPAARAVSTWDAAETQTLLGELANNLGVDKMARLEKFAQVIQANADADLQLMVKSGRMSQQQYADIKAMNDFYAPFRVMKYQEALEGSAAGTGRQIDTTQPLSKAIQGISDDEFRLGDMLTAFKQNTLRAHVLADKNEAMLQMAALAPLDKNGTFIQELKPHAKPPEGWATVNFMRDGKPFQLAVQPEVANAVKGLDPLQLGLVGKYLAFAATPLRLGATGANMAFQIVNQFKDQARLALVSKYGLRSVHDVYRYPMDFLTAVGASWKSNVFNSKNQLATDFLNSGAARSTIASTLSPDSFTRIARNSDRSTVARMLGVPTDVIIDTVARIGNAIEETSKMMGYKRGARIEELDQLTGKAREDALARVAYEVRNYAGSPDFSKHGTIGREMNLLFMFANARIQGAAADLRRLAGRTGTAEAAAAGAKLSVGVGIPTLAAWYLNHSPENAADWENRPQYEKNNYWLIPRYDQNGPRYFVNDRGDRVREYWRIPKAEIVAQVANTIESGLEFAKKKDPAALVQAGTSFFENLSPVPISGRNMNERLESMISGANPAIKGPMELAIGRDTFRHRDIVPERLKNASPTLQFDAHTPTPFVKTAQSMPEWMPDRMRSPMHLQHLVENATGSMLTQFMRPDQEGRDPLASHPILGRFFSSPYNNNEVDWDKIGKLRTSETDRTVLREDAIDKFLKAAPTLTQQQRVQSIIQIAGSDPEKNIPALVQGMRDKAAGTTGMDRVVRALAPKERAQFLEEKAAEIDSPEGKRRFYVDMLKRGVLTEDTAKEIVNLRSAEKQPSLR